MGYGLGGSGTGYLRNTGAQQINGGSLTIVADNQAANIPLVIKDITGGGPLRQLFELFDGFANPIWNIANAGGAAVDGDRLSAFRGGDIFNSDFQTITAVSDNVVANAAGVRLGHGTTQSVALFVGVGLPTAANPISSGMPPNGSIYFRTDGGAGTTVYQARAGAWVATAA